MSNFGVTYLLKAYKNGMRLSIEDNIGEELHIHFGNMRIMYNNKEFRDVASHALNMISDASGVSKEVLQKLDPIFLFDLCRRNELESFELGEEKYVNVGDLYCPVTNRFGLNRYKKIKHSEFIKIYKNGYGTTTYDKGQINYLGDDNVIRCKNVLELCKNDKEICEKVPLYVTGNNIIRDGQHRAAALYYLYGSNHKVKVQMMTTSVTKYLSTKYSIRFYLSFYFKYLVRLPRFLLSNIKRIPSNKRIKNKKKFYYLVKNKCFDNESYIDLKEDVELKNTLFFVDRGDYFEELPILIIKKGYQLNHVFQMLKKHGVNWCDGHINDNYSFIYGLKSDYLLYNEEKRPVAFLQQKLSCEAMSVKSFMPFAPEVWNFCNKNDEINIYIRYLLRLTKCMFSKERGGNHFLIIMTLISLTKTLSCLMMHFFKKMDYFINRFLASPTN